MTREILLGTGIVAAISRGKLGPRDAYRPTDKPAIAALTAAELLVGAELARPSVRRQSGKK